MHFDILPSPYMDGVIPGRTVPIFPSDKEMQDRPSNTGICAIILAARSNSPLGIFAPGYKDVETFFTSMITELDRHATANGFLGASSWLSAADRGVAGEVMNIVYFESLDALHAYAHGPTHTEAMQWWQRSVGKQHHIGIMHEVLVAPPGGWEGVYVNYHPTGLGATTKEVEVDGERVWMSPLVQGKGQLRYSAGRLGRKFEVEREWRAFEGERAAEDLYRSPDVNA